MTDKNMFDILSKFDSASTRTVTESAGATRSRSSSAGDPAMHDILSKFYGAVSEAGVDTSVPAGDKNKAFDTLSDTDFDQPTSNTNGFKDMEYSQDSGINKIKSVTGNTTTDTSSSAYNQSMDTDLGTGKEVQNDMYTKDGEVTGSVASIVDPATNQAQVVTQNNRYQADAESGAAVRDIERSYAAMQNDVDDMFDDIHDVNESDDDNITTREQAFNKIVQMINDPEISKEELKNFIQAYEKIVSDTLQDTNEDVVSKDKRKGDDVVADKQAVDDIVQELSKSYADFVAQVEEERDDMSFFKKDKK